MKQLHAGLAFGPRPETATLGDLLERFHVIVNLRPHTDTSHWYVDKATDNDVEVISFQLDGPEGTAKDKQKLLDLVLRLGRMIVEEKRLIYIHCVDGARLAPLVAFPVWYFVMGQRDFDPIQDIRLQFDTKSLSNRRQQTQARAIIAALPGTLEWIRWFKRT
jgi:hypothetical protein